MDIEMTRIVKDPEERREELIQTAERLFAENGYEGTAVSDIVREINVGQGTFYHYFRSKEDILSAVAEKQLAPIAEEMIRIAKSTAHPTQKINAMFNSFLKANSSELGLMKLLHQKGNYLLHEKIEEVIEARVLPLMVETVYKGTEERYFNTECPDEAIMFLLASALFLANHFTSNPERRAKMCTALEKITARVLEFTGTSSTW
jgi:AcrR family transcriptional regulator